MRNPQILIIEDDDSTVFGYTSSLGNEKYSFQNAPDLKTAAKLLLSEQFDAVLLDLSLPDGRSLPLISEIRKHSSSAAIIVVTADSDIATAVGAMKEGADNYLVKPVDMDELEIQLNKYLEFSRLRKKEDVRKHLSRKSGPFWGESPAMRAVLEQAELAAESDTPILIQGDTGTGKGVLAKWMHNRSRRCSSIFVDLNCSTFRGDLLKSELFGHTRGAFTSAIKDRTGLIEAADGGTLFLDEIGDMDSEVQTLLLKVIEEKTFRRLGENKTRKSDFRLICATHKDIGQAVKNGGFREDLFYRISVFPLILPPLKERQIDLPGLAESILSDFGYSDSLSPEVQSLLKRQSWPGNIRELKNTLERALLVSRRQKLEVSHFPGLVLTEEMGVLGSGGKIRKLEDIEISYIKSVLNLFQGDKNKVCKALGISLSSLYRKLPLLEEKT